MCEAAREKLSRAAFARCYHPGVLRVRVALVALFVGLSVVAVAPTANGDEARPTLPVVYVSGSTEPRNSADAFADALRAAGFDVHVFLVWEPADPATNPYTTVSGNSRRLPGFVDDVLAETGAPQVDVVTWSQGGLVTRYWLKEFGGAQHVRSLVCPSEMACDEMSDTGTRLRALNTPTEALPGIEYFNITTRWDENAFPYTTNLMSGPGDYENLVTQDQCPLDPVFHTTMTHTPSVQSAVISALHGGPMRMTCMF